MRNLALAALVGITALSGCNLLGKKGGDGDAGPSAPSSTSTGASTPTASAAAPAAAAKSATLAQPKDERAWGVALDATNVYWSSNKSGAAGIRRAPRAGGPAVMLCKINDMLQAPEELFIDDKHVYTLAPALGPSAVYRGPKDGAGAPCEKVVDGVGLLQRGITKVGDTVFVAGTKKKGATIVAVDPAGKSKVLLEWGKPIDGLASDGKDLFFASVESLIDRRLMKVATTGGTPAEVGKAGGHLTYASGRLYFIGAGLQSVPPTGGEPTTHKGPMGSLSGLAVVGESIFVGGSAGIQIDNKGSVWRSTTNGSPLVEVAPVPGRVTSLAADAKDVYVVADGGVYRIAL